MAEVKLSGICKAFGEVPILHGIDLHIADGEFMVFVGPSGCGKSTLLRLIAGLEDITAGEMHIGARRVNDIPPAERGIAMVFQSYALYPHMNLRDNMGFGLKLAGWSPAQIDAAVTQAAQVLHIEHLLQRMPKDLSGGQRQRAAIGRAIVRQPEVFLFDEPLSNLDAALRGKMRYEFARLHQQLKTTMVYVTHDQVEAMTLATRIAVLNAGRLEQVGAPMALYEHPANRFVAGFIGAPAMNFIQATLLQADADAALVRTAGGETLRCAVDACRAPAGAPVLLGARPEHLLAGAADDATATDNALMTQVTFVEQLGSLTYAYASHPGSDEVLTCALAGEQRPRQGEALALLLPAHKAHLFDAQGLAFPRLAAAHAA